MVKKAIRVETKAKIQISVSRDINQNYHKGNWSIHIPTAKANPWTQASKDIGSEKPKIWDPEFLTALPCSNNSKLFIKAWQKKKKDYCRQKQQNS